MKFNKLLASLALALGAAALSSSAFAVGAIAVDDEVGDNEPGYGFATGYDTKDQARAEALKQCKQSGNSNCKVVAWFETCGAYAASAKYYGAGWGSTKAKAESMAMEKCGGGCKIHVSECE